MTHNLRPINKRADCWYDLICMHIHKGIPSTGMVWIPILLLIGARVTVSISIRLCIVRKVASSLGDMIILKASTNRAWKSIWENIILWLLITRIGSKPYCRDWSTRWTRRRQWSCIREGHRLCMCRCSRRQWWLIRMIIKLCLPWDQWKYFSENKNAFN